MNRCLICRHNKAEITDVRGRLVFEQRVTRILIERGSNLPERVSSFLFRIKSKSYLLIFLGTLLLHRMHDSNVQ